MIGTVAGVIGLILTVKVLLSVSALRAHFLFAARIPQIIEALQQNASALSVGLTDYDASQHVIDVELAKCRANLDNLSDKVRSSTRKNVDALTKKIASSGRTKDNVRDIYTALNGLIQELHNLREDMRWSDTNG